MRNLTAQQEHTGREREQGFTLIELIVALGISSLLLILVLNLLDLNTRVGTVQTDLSTVQQTQRILHNLIGDQVRMTGRGGLRLQTSLDVADNVTAAYKVAGNETVDGSDVLMLRGVFENIFVVDSENAATFDYDDAAEVGTIRIESIMPSRISQQPLDVFEDAISDGLGVAIIVVSAQNNATYAVVELDTTNSSVSAADVNGDGSVDAWEKRAVLSFSGAPNNSANNAKFMALSSTPDVWPATLTVAASVGILQEYHYYLRDTNTAAEGNRPKLSRAEYFPNTQTVVGDASNGRVDIADNVADFQVARAFDRDTDNQIDENFENPNLDEWLGNHSGDGPPAASVNGFATEVDYAAANWNLGLVTHVAISSLVQTDRVDLSYIAPLMANFENHMYSEVANPTDIEEIIDRRHRRRQHRTVVEMRNI